MTTGIAVLPTRESAIEADKAKNLKDNLWFRSLPGNVGSGAERVHIAGGYAAGMVWGRYIVFSYATFSDGHTPTAKEKSLGKVSSAFRGPDRQGRGAPRQKLSERAPRTRTTSSALHAERAHPAGLDGPRPDLRFRVE